MKKNTALVLTVIMASATATVANAASCNSEIREQAVQKAEQDKGGRCVAGLITYSGEGASEQLREAGTVYVTCTMNISAMSVAQVPVSYAFSILPENGECNLVWF